MMNTVVRRTLLAILVGIVHAACSSPRSPREHADGDISGRWSAESVSVARPADTGTVRWVLLLAQHPAGRLTGEGTLARGGGTTAFSLHGLRDRHEVQMKLDLPGGSAMYHGGLVDLRTIVGELFLEHDTLVVTFTRETVMRREPAPSASDASPR